MSENVITNLRNHFLIATASLNSTRFERSVIYICNHDANGAMGMVINQPMKNVSFQDITISMGIEDMLKASIDAPPIIFNGGPVDANRGFVIHSNDYQIKNTIHVGPTVALSATADIVTDIAKGRGPEAMNFCLGYSGWGAGQLENELTQNSWFVLPEDDQILFTLPTDQRYEACTRKLGLSASNFSDQIIGIA